MSVLPVATTTRVLRAGLDLLLIGLAALVVVQSSSRPAAVVAAVLLAVVYVAGRFVIRPSDRGIDGPRGRWWPDATWIVLLVALWLGVLVAAGTPGIWLAFPLMLLQMHVLGPRRGTAAVVITTAAAVAAGVTSGLDSVGATLGPVLGGALSIGVVVTLETVLRESETRQALIDELVATREQLAASEHARGVAGERERLAREIHDTVAQGLASIDLLLRVADETGDVTQVQRAREVARENLAEVRHVVRGLAPADLEGSTVEEALARVVARTDAIDHHWSVTGEPRELPVAVSAALVRAAQSALANVSRHAQAARVDVTLSYLDDAVVLDVRDDGIGFEPDRAGFGLTTLRTRVEELGGTVVLESAPGHGTALAVQVPA